MNSVRWQVRAANHYGSGMIGSLVVATLFVAFLTADREYWGAIWAGAIAMIAYTSYVALVRNHLTVSWLTVERNAYRIGAVLGLTALSVVLVELDLSPSFLDLRNPRYSAPERSLERISHGLGVALFPSVIAMVSRLVLRQLRVSKGTTSQGTTNDYSQSSV